MEQSVVILDYIRLQFSLFEMRLNALAEYVALQIATKGFVVLDDLLEQSNVLALKDRFLVLKNEDEFEKAGIGKQIHYTINANVRGDFIRWIDEKDTLSVTFPLFQIIQAFIVQLNRMCYLGIKDLESHYAFYPPGKGYEMHRDRFKNNQHRMISFVLYLNDGWKPADGGELVLYDESKKIIKQVEPMENRLVVFLSEILHEVLPCNKERKSITGWLLDAPKELTFIAH